MAYQLESLLPAEPILVIRYMGDRVEDDIPASTQEIARLLQGMEGPIYRIADFSEANVDLSAFMIGMARSTRGIEGTFSDPRMRPIFVGTQDLINLAVAAARQEQYGGLYIVAFPTLDEALAYARTEISRRRLTP